MELRLFWKDDLVFYAMKYSCQSSAFYLVSLEYDLDHIVAFCACQHQSCTREGSSGGGLLRESQKNPVLQESWRSASLITCQMVEVEVLQL